MLFICVLKGCILGMEMSSISKESLSHRVHHAAKLKLKYLCKCHIYWEMQYINDHVFSGLDKENVYENLQVTLKSQHK